MNKNKPNILLIVLQFNDITFIHFKFKELISTSFKLSVILLEAKGFLGWFCLDPIIFFIFKAAENNTNTFLISINFIFNIKSKTAQNRSRVISHHLLIKSIHRKILFDAIEIFKDQKEMHVNDCVTFLMATFIHKKI